MAATVRTSLSDDLHVAAERELRALAKRDPSRQGAAPYWAPRELVWEFGHRSDAELFYANAWSVPGVLRARID